MHPTASPSFDSAPTARGLVSIERLDHLVLTVSELERSALFYEHTLGMRRCSFEGGRTAVLFGRQKLNLKAREPGTAPFSPADFCLITGDPIDSILEVLRGAGLDATGPFSRTGALGPMSSVYLRDPDGNLLELASYGSRDVDRRAS